MKRMLLASLSTMISSQIVADETIWLRLIEAVPQKSRAAKKVKEQISLDASYDPHLCKKYLHKHFNMLYNVRENSFDFTNNDLCVSDTESASLLLRYLADSIPLLAGARSGQPLSDTDFNPKKELNLDPRIHKGALFKLAYIYDLDPLNHIYGIQLLSYSNLDAVLDILNSLPNPTHTSHKKNQRKGSDKGIEKFLKNLIEQHNIPQTESSYHPSVRQKLTPRGPFRMDDPTAE